MTKPVISGISCQKDDVTLVVLIIIVNFDQTTLMLEKIWISEILPVNDHF